MPPGMDGMELARCFAAQWPETKVLFISGGKRREFSFLSKPFTDEELIAKIREILAPAPLERAAESGK